MNDLDLKFRNNKISVAELEQLRMQIKSMSDSELETFLSNSWLSDVDTSAVKDERMDRIKALIDNKIKKNDKKAIPLIRIAQVAAAILILFFISSTVYLYYENNQLSSEALIVSTGKNERANITLPDGTLVSLNFESELSYSPKLYNKKERKINFSGEGYFQVHKDVERTFIIGAKGMEVRVLGTVFNLSVRNSLNTAELSLENGSVSLQSVITSKKVILKPSQKAILNQLTGEIMVVDEKNIQDISAWRIGDMVFRNTSLQNVIQTIENSYNVNITVNCDSCFNDTFTGTMPISDLNEVLEIIEQSYSIKAYIEGKDIVLENRY